jgi:hypothetical protein
MGHPALATGVRSSVVDRRPKSEVEPEDGWQVAKW